MARDWIRNNPHETLRHAQLFAAHVESNAANAAGE
jgi:hypothetical protein